MDRNNLSGNPFSTAIYGLINSQSKIRLINLCECSLMDKGGEAVFSAMQRNNSITTVMLAHNGLGVLTSAALGKLLLEQFCQIKVVDISQNKIDV